MTCQLSARSWRRVRSSVALQVALAAMCVVVPAMKASPAEADAIRNQEWILSSLDVQGAQRYSNGRGVVVAVVDTGVDGKHVDLAGSVLAGVDFTSGSPRGVGAVDANGHGTGMAGLIVGHGHGIGHADGILGLAPEAKVLPIRLLANPESSSGGAGQAVAWATAHGASVISMSFAGPSANDQEAQAMAAAYRANVVLVAGAGNVNEGARQVEYPAAYPGVVAVAGTDEHGNHSRVSVTGNLITIAAPSDNIPSTYNTGGYAIGSGTSSSTAIVAGAAALIRSRFPNLTAGEVVNRLTATAIDKGPPGRDDEYGYGLLNLVGALTAKVPPAGSAATTPSTIASAPTAQAPTPTKNRTDSLTPASRSKTTMTISVVGIIVVALAVLGAWILVRRRRPG